MASAQRTSQTRMIWLLILFGVVFALLGVRLVFLQIVNGVELQAKAKSQWTKDSAVEAKRGRILDSSGKVLAQSASAVMITADPKQIKDARAVAQAMNAYLGLDEETVYKKITDFRYDSVSIMRRVDVKTADKLRDLKLAGVYYAEDRTRVYPKGELLSQVIGFTTVDSQGQAGLEKLYDKYLAGEDGHVYTERDRKGRELTQNGVDYVPPTSGYDVVTTFDVVIQSVAQEIAELCYAETGAKGVEIVVMDVNTGAVWAMVNEPGFDLNNPPRDDMSLLNSLSRNRIVADSLEPGSTFKILTAAAALDSGVATLNSHFYCAGHTTVSGDKIKCWRSYNPHGSQSFTQAVMNSCNPVFVDLALRMGREPFYEYLHSFGIGESTGIDLVGEAAGQMIAEKYVKDVDLARIGFGQSVAVTPIQLITAGCAVVNGGALYKPYVVSELRDENGQTVMKAEPQVVGHPIKPETSAIMREVLEQVVLEGGGRNAFVEGYRIGGKTGTAQKYVNGVVSSQLHIGSFIGFAPIDDPMFAVLVICDEPEIRPDFGSIVAAPYAGMLMERILQYKSILPVYEDGEAAREDPVSVPDVTGMSAEAAENTLASAGFRTARDGGGAKVTDQLPAAGATMPYGSLIILYHDSQEEETGEEGAQDQEVAVPDLTGKSVVEASRALNSIGLKLRINGSGGIAVSQEPSAGEAAKAGDTVRVTFEMP